LLYSFCQKGTTVIKIATAPDKFFVTLKGSVLIFIPRDPVEIAAERKLLTRILNRLQKDGGGKKKKDREYEIDGVVTSKNGFNEQMISSAANF